jgi:hypothetical protein
MQYEVKVKGDIVMALKVGYLGSCLSSMPIATLTESYGFEECFRIHHNRSDAFRRYHCEQTSTMIDRQWLDRFLVPNDDAKIAQDAKDILDNQMLPHIGYGATLKKNRNSDTTMFDMLRNTKIDVILLDNFMDIAAKLMVKTDEEGYSDSPLFLNPHFYKNKDEVTRAFKFTNFLTPEESAANWRAIYHWFRRLQQDALIIFLCFPYATSRHVPERFNRARDFYVEFLNIMQGEQLEIVPPLDVAEELTNGAADWYHVKAPLYRALAGYIYLRAVAKFPAMGQPYVLSNSLPQDNVVGKAA